MPALLSALAQQAPDPMPSLLGSLVQSAVALVAVCLAAWLSLRWAAKRGLGRPGAGQLVHVRERVALDVKHAVYVIDVGDKRLAVLVGSDGPATVLAELAREREREGARPDATRFADVLAAQSSRNEAE